MPWTFQWFDRVDRFGNSTNATTITTMTNVIYRSFTGSSAPPFTPINQQVPLTPGSYLKYVDTLENEVELVWVLRFANEANMFNFIRRYPPLFSPVKDPISVPDPNQAGANQNNMINLTADGKLRVTTPANNTRDLICRCISGFQVIEQDLNVSNLKVLLRFYANQPYWRAVDEIGFIGTGPVVLEPQTFRLFPMRLNKPGNLAGELSYKSQQKNANSAPVNNPGDVDTDIVWTVTGPCTSVKIENLDNQQFLYFRDLNNDPFTLGVGETLTIRTLNKTARKSGNGVNLNYIQYLTTDSSFWKMRPGNNQIRFTFTGADNVNTTVSGRFRPYYLGVY